MRTLGTRTGEGWRADILPLSVDGQLVAASLVLYVRRRAGLRAGALPWAGLVLGVSASVAANIFAAEPTVLGRVVAGWPPVAFALAFEMLVLLVRGSTAPAALGPAQVVAEDLDDQSEGGRPDWWVSAPFAATEGGRAVHTARPAGRAGERATTVTSEATTTRGGLRPDRHLGFRTA